ncbi:MAG: 30S ribosomal protein S6 [bacterium]
MSKVKSSETPHYELLYIISNKYSEDEIEPIKEKVTKLIIDNQGKITKNDDWGKKRLAYPIKHFRHGYYHLLEFDLDGNKLKIVEDWLRLSEQILRHQIVKKEKIQAVSTPLPIEKLAPLADPNKLAEPITEPKKKIEFQDLDDKLDKILDSDTFI